MIDSSELVYKYRCQIAVCYRAGEQKYNLQPARSQSEIVKNCHIVTLIHRRVTFPVKTPSLTSQLKSVNLLLLEDSCRRSERRSRNLMTAAMCEERKDDDHATMYCLVYFILSFCLPELSLNVKTKACLMSVDCQGVELIVHCHCHTLAIGSQELSSLL